MHRQADPRNARPIISVVVADFNGWDQTRHCLAALQDSNFKEFEVILVDHGTTDETRQGLLLEFPRTIRVAGGQDLWWAGATNLGIRTALEGNAQFIMLLNNDCNVKPDTIGVLLGFSRKLPNAIVAPVQRELSSGRYLCITPRDLLLLGFPSWPGGPKNITQEMRAQGVLPTRLISGGRGVLIPRSVFGTAGLLDEENLPHYCADHDFFFRCRAMNIQLYVAVDAEVYIDDHRTSSANHIERLSWREFFQTLKDTRSHRNITHLRVLFKKHYPVRFFYPVGLWLSILRYFTVYIVKRLRR